MPATEARADRSERSERTTATRETNRAVPSESKKQSSVVVTSTTNTKREIYYAPQSAVEAIVPFIKDYKTIWDPASGPSETYPLKDLLEAQGHRVVCTDILMGKEYDFFGYKTKKRYDIIVTTPPYSIRKEFIMRALDLKKPFAMLVPVNVLESKTMRDAFKQYGVSLIFPGKNTSFISPDDSRSVKALPYSMWILAGVGKVSPVVYL